MTSQKKRNTSPKKLKGSESLGVSVCLNIAEALWKYIPKGWSKAF